MTTIMLMVTTNYDHSSGDGGSNHNDGCGGDYDNYGRNDHNDGGSDYDDDMFEMF